MAAENLTTHADGTIVTYDRSRYTDYSGTPEALINAGLIQLAWVEGLEERHNRFIIGAGDRVEIIDHVGKGNHLNHAIRNAGLTVLKKNKDGTLRATKYRTDSEERALDEAQMEQYKAEAKQRECMRAKQREWVRAKEIRTAESLSIWKKSILREAKELSALMRGDMRFTDMPKIKFSRYDTARLNQAIDRLIAAIDDGTPVFSDVEAQHNVYSLSDRAYQ